MMSFHKSFRLICLAFRPAVVNTVKHSRNNQIRFSSNLINVNQSQSVDVPKNPRIGRQQYKAPSLDAGALFLLLFPVGAFGLGTWQIFRKSRKEKIFEELMRKMKQPPIPLPKDLNELEDMEYVPVRIKGKFHHDKELFLGPRTEIDEKNYGSSLISYPKGGYLVVTPFTLSDRKLTILVNRGWVPAHLKSPLARQEGQINGEVELTGLVRVSDNRKPLGMENKPEDGFWLYRDLETMSKATGAAPIMIDADKASTVPGGPTGGQTVINIPNDHLSYIITWYGLAILFSWLWYKKYREVKPMRLHYIYREA